MVLSKLKNEWPMLLPITAAWAAYFLLRSRLPNELAVHFTVEDGQWVPNGFQSPVMLMLTTTAIYFLVWGTVGSRYRTFLGPRGVWGVQAFALLVIGAMDVLLLWNGAQCNRSSGAINTGVLWVMLPVVNAFVYYIFRNGRSLGGGERPLSTSYYRILWWLTHILVNASILLPLAAVSGLGIARNTKAFELLTLAFLAMLGNICYNIRPNAFIGIRTPWTLGSAVVWRKTHHMSGVLLVATAVAGMLRILFYPATGFPPILFTVIGTGVVLPAICSYFFHRQQQAAA